MPSPASTGIGAEPPAGRLVGRCDLRLWSLSQAERWRRSLRRAGVAEVAEDGAELPADGSVVLVRAEMVLDDGLVKALARAPGTLLALGRPDGTRMPAAAHVRAAAAAAIVALMGDGLVRTDDPRLDGLRVLGPKELGSGHDVALRKRAKPYAVSLAETPPREVEKRLFDGAYKGVTDAVTKYLWPAPARLVTRWCAAAGISPNTVTTVSLAFVLVALWSFAAGDFGVGLVAAWIMTFLDTVDGKLARVTLTSSRWGNAFDHGIDLLHPPFWYWAWWYGLMHGAAAPAGWTVSDPALWVVIAGYVAGRLMEGFFMWRFGMEIHVWRRLDSLFRLATARRNPNLVILTLACLAGRPDLGFGLMAVWTAVSLAFHGLRIVQASALKARGRPPVSWLAEPEAGAG